MVTKQEQLEWLASVWDEWSLDRDFILMSVITTGHSMSPAACASHQNHKITKQEWQRERDRNAALNSITMQMCELKLLERDKMQKQNDNTRDLADSEKEIEKIDLQINVYGTKQDNSWHERGELPPVGCECEVNCGGDWVRAEVLKSRKNESGLRVAAVMDCKTFAVFWSCKFRPLRTEREKAINEMATLAMDCKKYDITQNVAKAVCELLYDAGYRKQ